MENTARTVDLKGQVLTSEMIDEATGAFIENGLKAANEETAPAGEEVSMEATAPVNFTGARKGIRNVGTKKMNLVNRLAQHLGRLQAKGINTDYVLKKFTDWKGPIRTPTKKISGIISQVKAFENA